MKYIGISLLLLSLTGCGSFLSLPDTQSERLSGYSYIPLDPLPIDKRYGRDCKFNSSLQLLNGSTYRPVLKSLPDNAIRMAVRQIDGSGNLSIGPASISEKNKHYQVVLDYINADTANIYFDIEINKENKDGKETLSIVRVERIPGKNDEGYDPNKSGNVTIPVYVGVGLRLTAEINAIEGGVNLSSLGAIAAGVKAGKATGTLTVQTLGVTGKQVSMALPLPSELNESTIQNAILSLGNIKAMMYDDKSTVIYPRVTGLYLPIRNPTEELINMIVSELAKQKVPWYSPCDNPPTPTT